MKKISSFLQQCKATGMSVSPQPALQHQVQSAEFRASDGFMHVRNCKLHNKHRHRILWTKLVLVKLGTCYPWPPAYDS